MTIDTRTYAATEINTLYYNDERSIDEKYGKLIAPYFKLIITDKEDNVMFSAGNIANSGGYDLNGLIVNDVSMEEDIEGADSITITVNNPKVDLQNSLLFEIGNNIDIFMGYDGRPLFYMMRGIIVEVQPDFPSDAIPTIKIVAYDKSYFMMEEGKAEIVPDGSAWWQRRRGPATGGGQDPNPRVINDSFPSSRMSDADFAQAVRDNTQLDAQGSDVRRRLVGGVDVGPSPSEMTGIVIRGETIGGPPTSNASDDANNPMLNYDAARDEIGLTDEDEAVAQTAASAGPMTWQRQRFGGRRRRAGKVWSGKTDSEIVATIFKSYGITPYIEATNERTGTSRRRRRPNPNGTGATPENTGRPSTSGNRYVYGSIDESTELILSEAERSRIVSAQNQNGNYQEVEWVPEDTASSADMEAMGFDPTEVSVGNRDAHQETPDTGNDVHDYNLPTDQLAAESGAYRMSDNDYVDALHVGSTNIQLWAGASETYGPDDQIRIDGHILQLVDIIQPEETPAQPPSRNRPRRVTQKAGTTDWDFIKKLGEKHAFILFVFFHLESERWIGYWGPEGNVPQFRQYTFRYNAGYETTLGAVKPNMSAKNQSTEIDLIYVDPVNGRENRLRVAIDNLNEYTEGIRGQGDSLETREPIGDGPEVVLRIHGERVRVNANHRFTSAEDARIWLMSYWMAHARDFYLIEGDTLVGIPEMRAREYHNILGIGRYEGNFFITQTTHNMSAGQLYKTSFVGRAKSAWLEGDEQRDNTLVADQNAVGEINPGPEAVNNQENIRRLAH